MLNVSQELIVMLIFPPSYLSHLNTFIQWVKYKKTPALSQWQEHNEIQSNYSKNLDTRVSTYLSIRFICCSLNNELWL